MRKHAADLAADAESHIENLHPDPRGTRTAPGMRPAVTSSAAARGHVDLDGATPCSSTSGRVLEIRADPSTPYHQALLDPSARVVLHRASGGRSALAAATLQEVGDERVAHLDGGLNTWKAAGKAVA